MLLTPECGKVTFTQALHPGAFFGAGSVSKKQACNFNTKNILTRVSDIAFEFIVCRQQQAKNTGQHNTHDYQTSHFAEMILKNWRLQKPSKWAANK